MRVHGLERLLQTDQAPHEYSKGVTVAFNGGCFTPKEFRRLIARGADNDIGTPLLLLPPALDPSRASEVPQLAGSFGRDDDVAGFDIEMNDTLTVNVMEGLANFRECSKRRK